MTQKKGPAAGDGRAQGKNSSRWRTNSHQNTEVATPRQESIRAELIGCELTWRRAGAGWLLLHNRRRMGRVVPDTQYPGMWRSIKSHGRLSDIANLPHAKNAVLIAAERELEFEDRQRRATDPAKCPEKRGVLPDTAPPVRSSGAIGVRSSRIGSSLSGGAE
jgi:hypothetical protein